MEAKRQSATERLQVQTARIRLENDDSGKRTRSDASNRGKEMLLSCEFSGFVVRVDVERMVVTADLHVGGSPVDVKFVNAE